MRYRSWALVCLFSLALAATSSFVASGCTPTSRSEAPADSCARWSARICRQTEDGSELCSAVKTTTEWLSAAACQVALADRDYSAKKLAERKLRCPDLASRLCHDIGEKSRGCKTAREGTRQFTPERCSEMLGQYAKVLDELKQQAKIGQLTPELTARLSAGDPPAFGPSDAKLQLVEFIDFENRDCVQAATLVRTLHEKYGAQLHFVVRQFPLPYNPHAELAAEAALAAQAQGKFWPFHDALLANQKQLERPALTRYASDVQLDAAQFKLALDQKKYAAAVAADKALGDQLSVVGMPTMFLNGQRLLNAVDQQGVIDAIEERLAATK